MPRGGAAQDDLVRGTPVELGLRQRGRSLVGGRAGIDEVEPPCPADRAWIDADVDHPADARRRRLGVDGLGRARGPSASVRTRRSARSALTSSVAAMERRAELQRDRRARALEREEVQLVATNDGIQPAGLGHLHEQAQVGLARLDEARPARPLSLAHDDEADIARELRRELMGGQLEHRAQGLALPQPVEPVVGADPEDMAQVSLVPMLEDRHVADEQVLSVPTTPSRSAAPGSVAGRLSDADELVKVSSHCAGIDRPCRTTARLSVAASSRGMGWPSTSTTTWTTADAATAVTARADADERWDADRPRRGTAPGR